MWTAGFIAMFALVFQGPLVLDRIAVVVNRHPIKTSDIERDVRLTEFLNQASLNLSSGERKSSEERLIDQQLIRAELSSGGFNRATDQDADALLEQLRRERFGDSDLRLKQTLEHYGVTEAQLREQLLLQLTVLNFINQRFRAGVLVSEDEIGNYYSEHRGAFPGPLNEAVSLSIRQQLEGQQVNQQFEDWLAQAHKDAAIDYKVDYGKEGPP
jgi:peptidyl-prolyl cis-trans isomerase SurA